MPWLSCIISNVVLASFLALMAWMVQRSRRGQTVARFLWVLVLVKLVTPALVSFPVYELPAAWACAIGACGCEQHSRLGSSVRDALPWLLLATWMIGAGATVWAAWRRWARFQRLLAHAAPAPAEWQSLVARLAAELSLRRLPQILAVPGRLPPLVVAGRRGPRMLLPLDLIACLSGSQRETLLLHELVHIQRRDHLVRILELTVRAVYWWLPGIGSIGRYLRDCEEACCDEAVLAHLPHARRDYARLLLDVLDFAAPLPRQAVAQVTAMSAAHDLERRLRTILDSHPKTRRAGSAAAFATGAVAMGIACAILPCGLRYDFIGGTKRLSDSAEIAPAAGETCSPDSSQEHIRSATMCCPS